MQHSNTTVSNTVSTTSSSTNVALQTLVSVPSSVTSPQDEKPKKQVEFKEKPIIKDKQKAKGFLSHFLPVRYYKFKPKNVEDIMIPRSDSAVCWNDVSSKKSEEAITSLKEGEEKISVHILIRIFVLFLFFVWVIGPSMGYSLLGALSHWEKSSLSMSDTQYSILFAMYGAPNIIIALLFGFVIDWLGTGVPSVLITALCLLGYFLALIPNYYVALVARALIGISAESQSTVRNTILAKWFKNDSTISLAFSSSICLVSFRMSAFIVLFGVPSIAQNISLEWGKLTVICFGVVSFAACVLLIGIGTYYSKYLKQQNPPKMKSLESVTKKKCGGRFACNFSITFWILLMGVFCFYSSTLPFIAVANQFIALKWKFEPFLASMCSSLVHGVAAVTMLFAGFFIDRFGHRVILLILSFVLVIVGFDLLLWTDVTPWVATTLLGIAYGIGPCALFPAVPLLVPPESIGMAYGFLNSLLNLGLFAVPFYLGFIPNSYWKLFALFMHAVIGLLCAIVLLIWDLSFNKGVLEYTVVKRVRKDKKDKKKKKEDKNLQGQVEPSPPFGKLHSSDSDHSDSEVAPHQESLVMNKIHSLHPSHAIAMDELEEVQIEEHKN